MKRAIGFEGAAVEIGMDSIAAEWILRGAYKAREDFAIALQARCVPDNLKFGGMFLELCNLSFAQAYGRNLLCFGLSH
jgi:hypothetical protein